MRKLLLIVLALGLAAGCKRALDKVAEDTQIKEDEKFKSTKDYLTQQKGAGPEQPAVHAPTGTVLNPVASGGGGGSGGAAQEVRRAATRTVNQHELNNLRLFIDTASLASGRMPSVQEITAALQKEAPATYKLVHERVIILTGTQTRESIWAYTYQPQTVDGIHLVVTSSGIERMNANELRQKLQQQQGR
jgi:hypothetical protein